MKKTKLRITTKALTARLNRALAKQGSMGEKLRKTRSTQMLVDVGEYFTVDMQGNYVTRTHVDLEHLGRELHCLASYEALAD
jgi:hypothetical protein